MSVGVPWQSRRAPMVDMPCHAWCALPQLAAFDVASDCVATTQNNVGHIDCEPLTLCGDIIDMISWYCVATTQKKTWVTSDSLSVCYSARLIGFTQ